MGLSLLRTADGSLTLMDEELGEAYRSRFGAASEARLIFLEPSGLGERLRAGLDCTVIEVGFGLGLNFIQAAEEAARHGAALRFVSSEIALADPALLASLDYGPLHAELCAWLATARSGGWQRWDKGRVHLDLFLGSASEAEFPKLQADALYLDGFSPRSNPSAWETDLIVRLAALLKPEGRAVSFSVARQVKDSLKKAGMRVEKTAGSPGKSQILKAYF